MGSVAKSAHTFMKGLKTALALSIALLNATFSDAKELRVFLFEQVSRHALTQRQPSGHLINEQPIIDVNRFLHLVSHHSMSDSVSNHVQDSTGPNQVIDFLANSFHGKNLLQREVAPLLRFQD
jgi:hypothetical protein